jgi:MFS family permease
MLGAVVVAQTATTVVATTPAFLIPALMRERGLSLVEAGLVAAAPNFGLVLTLVAWGWATDRWGERRILLIGLASTTVAIALSCLATNLVWLGLALVLAGALSACTNSASGRLITGWFPRERRGLAMGIRQSCQPIGVAIAALAVPALARWGLDVALAFGGVLVLISLALVAVVVVDPMRDAAKPEAPTATLAANPYRRSTVLQRIHAVSILLVVPQFTLSIFGLVWFIAAFGWSEVAAGTVVAVAQLAGAGSRIVAGQLSDAVRSRLRPLRWVAYAGVATMLGTALFGWLDWVWPAAITYVLATCISVADNGLAFTAVAEIAGPNWSGRALGIQNTGQFLAAAVVPPVVGAIIGLIGFPAAFALVALTPGIAAPLIPSSRLEHSHAR